MRNQKTKCNVCEFKATPANNMGNHVNLEHKVKKCFLIFSCWVSYKDFDLNHGIWKINSGNIHDIRIETECDNLND